MKGFAYNIEGKAIHSISRSEFNRKLVELAEALPNVTITLIPTAIMWILIRG